jgi:hypothetical protein
MKSVSAVESVLAAAKIKNKKRKLRETLRETWFQTAK